MELMASYCLCGQPYDPNIFMIQCDICKDWFHGSCTNFQEHTAIELDKYHCPKCSVVCGPSLFKPFKNYHRHDYWDDEASNKPVQTGTGEFIHELKGRHFHHEGEVVIHLKGSQLTEMYFKENSFSAPIVVDTIEGLDMTIPEDYLSLEDIESYVGENFEIDVIDVVRQMDVKMKLGEFVRYFNSPERTRVLNVVSLEFSKTRLTKLVEAPQIARKLDWANIMWPVDYVIEKPCVQKYCLMSVKDSYTDFHVDFGGTSVWYHVLRGQKIFYLIKPTAANLTLYQQWMTSSNQSETFFGDQVDQCVKCVLNKGQTMFIPTGWIHAVLTPMDSLVFGGNFLHSYNIAMQLQVYEIERKVKTAAKFLYPYFETMHWFAVTKLLQELQQINSECGKCPQILLQGLKSIHSYLKLWNTDKDFTMASREQIPMGYNVAKLFKDITKEVRQAERYLNSINPPKPERESKRKRKKPINKDFVDYSLNKSSLEFMKPEHLPAKVNKKSQAPIKLVLPKPSVSLDTKMPAIRQSEVPDFPSDEFKSETTTAIHRGGTVLKIKLGPKDIIPIVDHSNVKVEGDISLQKSIYDFQDDSEREEDCFLSIDESPKPKVKGHNKTKQISTWADDTKEGLSLQNGIESLLKASALTNKIIESDEQGRTSPSTQEAIAGMLSISQTYIPPKKSKKKRPNYDEPPYVDDDANDVHQDEDYVYPALDNSDDDAYNKPKARTSVDESWSPKARVGPLMPKLNRPAREGTKKQAVEKVLEAAAKRTSGSSNKSAKRTYRRKKSKVATKTPLLAQSEEYSIPGASGKAGPSAAKSPLSKTPASISKATENKGPPKSKKGMKTAKQRLGKILKLHKMMH